MNKVLGVFALSIGFFAASSYADTITPNGSFSGYQIGTTTANGITQGGTWAIGDLTTSIAVTATHGISSTADTYLGNLNNLSILHDGSVSDGSLFSLSSDTFSVTSGVLSTALTLTVNSYTFSFDNEIITNKTNGNIGLYFSGNLMTDSMGRLTTPARASFSVTFTQSAETGAIGTAYSLDTPPRVIPEPATLGLFGIGLLGFAASRFRKAA